MELLPDDDGSHGTPACCKLAMSAAVELSASSTSGTLKREGKIVGTTKDFQIPHLSRAMDM
jgi:hypothetical protein